MRSRGLRQEVSVRIIGRVKSGWAVILISNSTIYFISFFKISLCLGVVQWGFNRIGLSLITFIYVQLYQFFRCHLKKPPY